MEKRHLLIHLDDSQTKQRLVAEAWQEAGGKRDDVLQTEDPNEALAMVHDLAAEILDLVTDEDIEGEGSWAIRMVEAATRERIPHILVYSGSLPSSLPRGVDGLPRSNDPNMDRVALADWFRKAV